MTENTPTPAELIDDALSYLDEMNNTGRIEYDDYSNLHDLISTIAPQPFEPFELFPGTLAALDDLTEVTKRGQGR